MKAQQVKKININVKLCNF